jgi:hypothetical protein
MPAVLISLLHTWWLLLIGALLLSPVAATYPRLISCCYVAILGWNVHLLAQKPLTSWKTYVAWGLFLASATLSLFLAFSFWFWQDLPL